MYRITEGTSAQWDIVAKGLAAFNQKQLGFAFAPPEKMTRVALDENDKVMGGILCTHLDLLRHLYVDVFWVDASHRGSGIGGALLRAAENFARKLSCTLVQLETLDFQVKGFYLKQGYTVFGDLEGPACHTCYFMKKNCSIATARTVLFALCWRAAKTQNISTMSLCRIVLFYAVCKFALITAHPIASRH